MHSGTDPAGAMGQAAAGGVSAAGSAADLAMKMIKGDEVSWVLGLWEGGMGVGPGSASRGVWASSQDDRGRG